MSNPFIDAGYTGPLSEVQFVQAAKRYDGGCVEVFVCKANAPLSTWGDWVVIKETPTVLEAIKLTYKLNDYLHAYKALTGADS